jgi:hypothetical protein
MRRICLVFVLAILCMEMTAEIASAQLFPRGRRSSGGYDIDAYDTAVGMNALSNSTAAASELAQSYQSWRQQTGSSQMSATQSSIRSTMGADAERRSQDIAAQRQSHRDWWFQTQQQQVAQRQAAPARSDTVVVPYIPAPSPSATSSPSVYTPPAGFEAASAAPVSNIIKWPPVLSGPGFAQQRAQIEAPYLRGVNGLSTPTADDYRNMIKTTEQMKTMLKYVADVVSAQDYLTATAFLDKLAAEARDRLKNTSRTR